MRKCQPKTWRDDEYARGSAFRLLGSNASEADQSVEFYGLSWSFVGLHFRCSHLHTRKSHVEQRYLVARLRRYRASMNELAPGRLDYEEMLVCEGKKCILHEDEEGMLFDPPNWSQGNSLVPLASFSW